MNFVAEWFSHGGTKVLQGVSFSVWENILNDIDDLTWEDLSEDWQKCVRGRRKSCLVKQATGSQEGCLHHQVRKRAPMCSEVSFGVCWMPGGYIWSRMSLVENFR